MSDNWPSRKGDTQTEPRPPAVTFVTTEHFVLQGARAATIAESTGRANMFVAAVSGGLIALGLVATASRVGIAFYAFGLVPFPAPEIAPYLLSVPPAERLGVQGLVGARWQEFRTVAGMVGLITSVLAGSTATLASILLFDHSLAAALIAGGLVALRCWPRSCASSVPYGTENQARRSSGTEASKACRAVVRRALAETAATSSARVRP